MPQLNPDPWFSTMLATWLPMLAIMTKIIAFSPTLTPTTQNFKTTKTTWAWPWH